MKTLSTILIAAALAVAALGQDAHNILTNAGAPTNGTSEVQTLTIGGSTTGGTFKLTFDGFTTSAISFSATTATLLARINTALDALPNLENGEVVATEGSLTSGNGTILLTFGGNRAKLNVNQMTLTNSLTGGTHTLAISTSTPGVDATARNAALGQLLVDTTNKLLYQNQGTALNPTWTLVPGDASALTETSTNTLTNKTLTTPVINGATSASGDFDLSGSTGTTKTTTGVNTIGGATVFAANKGVTVSAGTSAFDFSGGTGVTKTTTGLFTVSGGAAVSTTTLSGAGAISVVKGTTKVTSTGAGDALTLANGTDGQIITIIHDVDGGSAVLTPTTKTGFTTITFTNAGESATLEYVTTRGWIILALNGAVAG